MTVHIKDILETALYVDDLDAAERFYTEVLGLTVDSKANGRHIFFRIGDRMLLLFSPDATSELDSDPNAAPSHGTRGPGHVAFSIAPDEFEAWRDRLTSHSVVIEKELDWGGRGRSLYFRDPAGNSLEVTIPAIWGIEGEKP